METTWGKETTDIQHFRSHKWKSCLYFSTFTQELIIYILYGKVGSYFWLQDNVLCQLLGQIRNVAILTLVYLANLVTSWSYLIIDCPIKSLYGVKRLLIRICKTVTKGWNNTSCNNEMKFGNNTQYIKYLFVSHPNIK